MRESVSESGSLQVQHVRASTAMVSIPPLPCCLDGARQYNMAPPICAAVQQQKSEVTKNNTKPHGHKPRLNKGDPCEYVRSYVLRLFHTHEKNKTHSHKNRLKEGRPLRVRDRTYYDCFTLMPFRRDPKRAVLRTEFINNGSPCEYEKGVRSYKQNKTHANFV